MCVTLISLWAHGVEEARSHPGDSHGRQPVEGDEIDAPRWTPILAAGAEKSLAVPGGLEPPTNGLGNRE